MLQFIVGDASQYRRVIDLASVEVQNRQHGSIPDRVKKFVRVPGGRQRSGLRFAITHNASGDQVGIIEHRSERVGETVSEFAPFVDGPGCFRSAMAADAAREGELSEKLFQALDVFTLVWKNFRICPLEINRGEYTRGPDKASRESGNSRHARTSASH